MTHEPLDQLISRLLDGDLPAAEARALRERIASDPDASRLYRELEATVLWTRSLAGERAPTSLIVGLREAIARDPWWRRWIERLLGAPVLTPARGLAFVLVAAVAVGVIWTVPQWRNPAVPAGEDLVLADVKNLSGGYVPVATAPAPAAAPAAPVAGTVAAESVPLPEERATRPRALGYVRNDDDSGARASAKREVADATVARPDRIAEPAADALAGRPAARAAVAGTSMRAVPLTVSPAPPPRVAGAPEPVSPIVAQPAAALVVYEPSGGFLSRVDRPVSAGGSFESFYAEEAADEFLPAKEETAPRRIGGAAAMPAATIARTKDAAKPAEQAPHPAFVFRLVRNAELAPLPKKGMADKTPEASRTGTIRVDAANVVREFKGSYSGLRDRGTFVIESRADWDALWDRMTANYRPAPKTPEIDFKADFAVGVAMGQKSSGGFEVTIAAIELVGKTLRVTVEERKPAAGMGMTLALSQPYHVLILPRLIGGQRFSAADGFTVEFVYQ